MHYRTILDRPAPEPEDTDPTSPMERKVLDWILKTPFYQRNEDRVEVLPKFRIGEYLRQLDPTYHHPPYRCDFLLLYRGYRKTLKIIIEYDGFKEHFMQHRQIHVANYDAYYRVEDIERQMVLESYGYKFLRINRFNLGTTQAITLSDRLTALVDATEQEVDTLVISKILRWRDCPQRRISQALSKMRSGQSQGIVL